ncbi:MAG: hypothetical protein AABX52_00330 [Nanoarchaeota archaeon]
MSETPKTPLLWYISWIPVYATIGYYSYHAGLASRTKREQRSGVSMIGQDTKKGQDSYDISNLHIINMKRRNQGEQLNTSIVYQKDNLRILAPQNESEAVRRILLDDYVQGFRQKCESLDDTLEVTLLGVMAVVEDNIVNLPVEFFTSERIGKTTIISAQRASVIALYAKDFRDKHNDCETLLYDFVRAYQTQGLRTMVEHIKGKRVLNDKK